MQVSSRHLFNGLFLLSLLAFAYFYASHIKSNVDIESIRQVEVKKGEIIHRVEAVGVLEARKVIEVGAQVSGQITSFPVAEGMYVRAGDLLAEIDPSIAENDLLSAEIELSKSQSDFKIKQEQYQLRKKRYERKSKMLREGATSVADLESAEVEYAVSATELDIAKANIGSLQIKVEIAKKQLSYTKIIAPIDGHILIINAEQGQTLVATQQAQKILTLADLNTMVVKTKVSESDILKLRVGMPAYFRLFSDATEKYHGELRSVDLVPSTAYLEGSSQAGADGAVYYYVRFIVPNSKGKLRVGMTAQVTIELEQINNVLVLPIQAIDSFDSAGSALVKFFDGGNITARKIQTGARDDVNVEVVSGLSEGNRVIPRDGNTP